MTGVQTCALPICSDKQSNTERANDTDAAKKSVSNAKLAKASAVARPGVPHPVSARPFLSAKKTTHHEAVQSVSD